MASFIFLVFALYTSGASGLLAGSLKSLIIPANNLSYLADAGFLADAPVTTKPKPMLALPFDDGPSQQTTPPILSALEKKHVKASFFVVGSRVKGNEKLLRRMHGNGFDIGNHSWNHPDFDNLTTKQIEKQITRTEKAIAAAGVPAPFMFRPPYGDLGKNFPHHFPLAIVF